MSAGIDPRQVGYVEAHGTGTPVGDPVEARAVGGVLGVGRPPQAALPMGSVKSNFGHLEPASGIAGVIKAVLSLKHRQLVPSLHYESPNPAIDFAGLGLRVVTQQEAWQEPPTGRRIAAVNSFGFGGTNAHAVLAEVLPPAPGAAEGEVSCQDRISTTASSPSAEDASAASGRGPSWLVPLSARSDAALQALAQSWIDWLGGLPPPAGPDLEAIAYTAAVRRMHHDHRLAIAARDTGHLRELIEAWSRGERRREISCGRVAPIAHQDASRDGRPGRTEGAEQDVRAGSSLRIAFVFNGMGSQWQGMGQELLETEPEFRQAVERVDQIFRELSGWSIAEQLQRDEFRSRINETEVTQPAIFAVQVGLAALWRSWGVEPALVVGHSVGEAAAACVAGALTLEDAVRVIFHRSRLQHRLRGQGRMLALGIPAEMAASLVAGYGGRVEIGAVNSPVSVTLSGEREALEELQYAMESAQTFCRFLPVDVPYHSSRMEAIESEFRQAITGIQSQPPAVRYFSTVTGQAADESPLDADYWWGNIRRPVLFASAMQTLLAAGAEAVIEIGSHPVLSHSIRECADGATASLDVLPSMRRNEPQQAELLSSLGRLHTLGHPVRWERLFPQRRTVVRLPSYPWQRESYWSESEENRWSRLGLGNPAGGLLARIQHPLLGQDVQTTGDQRIFHGRLDLNGPQAWLADHQVQGAVVFPAAGYVELALAAGKQLHPDQPLCLESVEIHRPLALTADRNATLETVVDPLSGDLAIRSRDSDGGASRYASCTVRADFGEWGERPADLAGLAQACAEPLAIDSLYDEFQRIGLNYGPCFRGIEEVRTGAGRAFGRVRLPEPLQAEAAQYVLCPAVLDACLQMVICAAHQDLAGPAAGTLYLPVRMKRLRLRDLAAISQLSSTGLTVETRLTERTASLVRADIFLFDSSGRAVGEIEGLEAVAFPVSREGQIALEDCLWVHRWELRAQQAESVSRTECHYRKSWQTPSRRGSPDCAIRPNVAAGTRRCCLNSNGLRRRLPPTHCNAWAWSFGRARSLPRRSWDNGLAWRIARSGSSTPCCGRWFGTAICRLLAAAIRS